MGVRVVSMKDEVEAVAVAAVGLLERELGERMRGYGKVLVLDDGEASSVVTSVGRGRTVAMLMDALRVVADQQRMDQGERRDLLALLGDLLGTSGRLDG